MPSTETHEYLWDTPVREIEGKENQGFLLAASGASLDPLFWAHYVDGLIEAIDPPEGFPRPEDDPAVRTKRVVIPPTLRTRAPGIAQKQGGRYTGQMRRVVQCQHSRGLESKFGYGWARTHGILEYPYPRQIGSTAGEEAAAFAKRRFWVIEISAAGVYAAPIGFGLQCMTCASHLSEYLDTGASGDLDLAWAFVNKNAGGKVQQLLHPGEIAPAYAKGGPWYQGMGWAFSWSGRAASNVVQRGRTLPDHYETRLIDLDFSVAFEGAAPVTLTQVGGIATALMPGHGFATGGLASISGAAIDAYNGAHVVTVLDSNAFTFAIAAGTASPAGGTPMIANANGTATIAAELTIGSAGRVTFRPNDLGTLWVPGGELTTRWDGIVPFFNIINASGPVHVFYDGEERIVTTWSMGTTTIAEDRLLTPRPPLATIPSHVNPNDHWAGVTNGFHYWADEPTYIGPIPQDNQIFNPAHPCMIKQTAAVVGSGHLYNGYTRLSWGFSGGVSLNADAYSRRRIETETHFVGGIYRDPMWDGSYGGSYRPCGGDGSQFCSALFISHAYSRDILKTRADASEIKRGSAALILFPLEREAVAGVKRASEHITTSSFSTPGKCQSIQIRQVGHALTPGCAFAQFILDRAPIPSAFASSPTVVTNTSTNSMSFALRASGGINLSGSLVDGASPVFDPFVVYQVGVKETADSSLLVMRGGLEYPDRALSPAAQMANHVKRIDGGYSLGGGFAALPAGRDPVAFIGQV